MRFWKGERSLVAVEVLASGCCVVVEGVMMSTKSEGRCGVEGGSRLCRRLCHRRVGLLGGEGGIGRNRLVGRSKLGDVAQPHTEKLRGDRPSRRLFPKAFVSMRRRLSLVAPFVDHFSGTIFRGVEEEREAVDSRRDVVGGGRRGNPVEGGVVLFLRKYLDVATSDKSQWFKSFAVRLYCALSGGHRKWGRWWWW